MTTIPLLSIAVFIAVLIAHSNAQVTMNSPILPGVPEVRMLQGFGVVGGGGGSNTSDGEESPFGSGIEGTTPTATTATGPVLPPAFAPRPVPATKPISVPVPTFMAPVPVVVPVRAPVPVSKPQSFGNSGSVAPIDIGRTTPSAVPTTLSDSPTTTDGIDIAAPTIMPTTAVGVVIVDVPTTATTVRPTISPVTESHNNGSPGRTWLSFVVTFTSELYTIVQDTQNIEDVLRAVHGDVRTSLHHLIKKQNVSSIYIELLESELLGTCPTIVNITNQDDMAFPNFPICNDVKAHIITKIDSSKIREDTIRSSFINYIGDSFIPSYNKNSSVARLRLMEPIIVSATLNITLVGVQTTMISDESTLFENTVRTVMLGVLLNGTQTNRITPMNLEGVKLLHQRVSTSKDHRILQDETTSKTATDDNDNFDGKPTNKIEVMITTSCTRDRTCTDDAFQQFLNEFAPDYGLPLMAALVADATHFYFDDLKNVIIGPFVVPELPPSMVQPQPTSVSENSIPSEKLPKWIILLIVAMGTIVISTILYIVVRRKARQMQGSDKLRDGIHKDTVNDEEKDNMLRNTPFTLTQAPSFQQIQEWSTGGVTHQPQQQPSRDISLFHKRGKGQQQQQQPIHEYEEEDDAYYDDQQRHDNDQFSVEAGNFGDTAYDEHQWNSSFRSYT